MTPLMSWVLVLTSAGYTVALVLLLIDRARLREPRRLSARAVERLRDEYARAPLGGHQTWDGERR